MTRRTALSLFGIPAIRLLGQSRPDSFRVYSDGPRIFLRPARLKLLRRERERQSLRWEQFDTLWNGNAPFPELGFAAALRYRIAEDDAAGRSAISWALSVPATDVRQIAIIADWCAPLLAKADQSRLFAKLQRAAAGPAPKTIGEARGVAMAAVVLSEAQPELAEKTLRAVFENFWLGSFIASIREARARVPNGDACAMMELLHVFRDNINFDLRDTFPAWFKEYPVIHLMAHYPAPWPASENEFRIPADPEIQKSGPNLEKAMLSRAAELSMVAFDSNSSETQLLQGFLMNDRFVMRGTYGIPYELMWANPYQPGLSYYHVPLAQHDEIGGQLFVRSTWEDDASWIGFFDGQLQLFSEGTVAQVNPKLAHEPMDIEEATVFFARDAKQFRVPKRPADEATDDVFIVGLEPKRGYHVEVDGQEMVEEHSDPGGIIYLPGLPTDAQVRLNLIQMDLL
ncbi:MAG TPA: hypothetical protein VFC21_08855 [Bryobacteraceae bacterium]|nr:hypothetical protein [Bryobacteraceae bacterium]